ncbi:hypothetical protein ANN_22393 [Periplaneta americana]|uniref:Uncharacterized protein n=1 Tax=Periplaneta americana TaxID=6978 RepID=A0ABQ8S810_PERAM|nr:hypothetical protein ANN_22393 [Periplaneta americana]
MDLREVGYDDRDWIDLAQDRDLWRAYVKMAMNLRVALMKRQQEAPYLKKRFISSRAALGASHKSDLPLDHGVKVKPSGRLPSERFMPTGSRMVGKPAEIRALLMMSLIMTCLENRPEFLRQLNPWRPEESTSAPQIHLCGKQILTPSLKAIAILKDVLSIKVPMLEEGKA